MNGAFASTATIANAVVEFARGFYICTYTNLTAHLRIAVGTNNNLLDGELTDAQTTAHGQAWSAMVTSINNTLRSGPIASQVDVAGA